MMSISILCVSTARDSAITNNPEFTYRRGDSYRPSVLRLLPERLRHQ